MPYEPPSYEELHFVTSEVQQIFNGFCGRYVPPSCEILRERVGSMEPLYRRYVSEKDNRFFGLSPDPIRLEEIACITYLVTHLPRTTIVSSDRNQVQNIILGALIYRRLFITASYAETVGGLVGAYFPFLRPVLRPVIGEEKMSALYRTIEETLEINRANALDNLSVATCCRAYLNYLREIGATRKSHYIRDEPDFFTKLERFTQDAELDARDVAEQIKLLVAIQVISGMLRATDRQVSLGLVSLSEAVAGQLSTKESLTRDDIIECMTALDLSDRVKSLIAELLPDDMLLTNDNAPSFVATMKLRLERNSQYVLLGAYVVVLNDAQTIYPNLAMTINTAIGALKPGNSIDNEARHLPLVALGNYLALPNMESDFDFRGWRGLKAIQQKVRGQTRELERIRDMAVPMSASIVA